MLAWCDSLLLVPPLVPGIEMLTFFPEMSLLNAFENVVMLAGYGYADGFGNGMNRQIIQEVSSAFPAVSQTLLKKIKKTLPGDQMAMS